MGKMRWFGPWTRIDCQDRLYNGNLAQQSRKVESQGKTETTLHMPLYSATAILLPLIGYETNV